MVPLESRLYNATGSQCCWVSLATIARLLGLTQLYDLPEHYRHASGAGEMTAVLRARGVRYAVVHDETGLRAALHYRLPIAIFIPGHCCVLVGLDETGARVLSNNHRTREVQAWSRAQFTRLWTHWGVVLYPPEGQVHEPAVFGTSAGLPPGIYGGLCPCPCGPDCACGDGCLCPELTAQAAHTIAEAAVLVQQGHAGGSGTVIDYDPVQQVALVASAAHVFGDTGPALVRYPGQPALKAYCVYYNRPTDVALLEVPMTAEPVCTGLALTEPEPGQKVYKLGYPAYAKGHLNIRTGVVKPRTGGFLFECSCYVRSGDSGGGIFLADGSLCSVITGFYGPYGQLDPTCMFGSGTGALHLALRRLREHGFTWKTDCCRQQRPIDRGVLPWNSPHPILPRQPEQINPGQLPAPKWRQPEPVAPAPAPAPTPAPGPAPLPATPATQPPAPAASPAPALVILGLLAAKLALLLATKGRR